MSDEVRSADVFRALHGPGELLVLANAWDAGSGASELLGDKIAAAKAGRGSGRRRSVRQRAHGRRAARSPERSVDETARRAALYRAAGCDGVFAAKLTERDAPRAVVAAVAPLPLNLLVMPGLPPADELRALGVGRLSSGSMLAAAVLGLVRERATRFLADGRSDALFGGAIEYGAMNALLAGR